MSAGAMAFADGKVTPTEAVQIDRAASKMESALGELRKALATTRADGGATISVFSGGRGV